MNKVSITTKENSHTYPILIGKDLLPEITQLAELDRYSQVFVITDTQIAPLFLQEVLAALPENAHHHIVPAGEKAKQIQTLQSIWLAMKQAHCDRKSVVITLGGGVICDMGGFAAATYMRGIDFIHIPTTLLSQVDASIGGKTAIDFAQVKNLIGTFTQPKAVIIDTNTLLTLPKREFLAGFAEIIKHGLIADKAYIHALTKKEPLQFTANELTDIITRSCEIKARIVISDEKEMGTRKLLNAGHTIGHAIEAVSLETDQPLLHGEAIALGIIAEAFIAKEKGLLSASDYTRIKHIFETAGLPTTYRISSSARTLLLEKMHMDKKNEHGTINFTLLTTIGNAILDQSVANDILQLGLQEVLRS